MAYANMVSIMENSYRKVFLRAWADTLAENDLDLKNNGWQTSTKGVFYQSAAPTGWTKDTSQNDKLLRIVSGAGGGTGGSKAPSTSFSINHTAHSISASGTHTHDFSSHIHQLGSVADALGTQIGATTQMVTDNGSGFLKHAGNSGSSPGTSYKNRVAAQGSITTGADGNHSHGGSTTGAALTDFTIAYADVIVCTKDTSSGFTDLNDTFAHNDKIDFDPFDIFADNDQFNKARLTPSGTEMVFGQAAAPTGWTKDVSVNNKALRIVSGSGGATGGGSFDIGTAIVLAHSHSITDGGGHSHTVPAHLCDLEVFSTGTNLVLPSDASSLIQADAGGALRRAGSSGPAASATCYKNVTANDGSGNTDSVADHSHSIGSSLSDVSIAYLDFIFCTKDSGGEPYPYEDLTAVFAFKKLVSRQRLTRIAKNDEYLHYHTVEATSKTVFFMAAAPSGWTKLTSINDRALRVVSGATGGSGGAGTQGLSATITLAHTHTISSVAHSHGIGSHTHTLDSGSQSVNPIGLAPYGPTSNNNVMLGYNANGGGAGLGKTTAAANSTSSDSKSHDHGAATGSLLTSVTLAYADVIYCEKN